MFVVKVCGQCRQELPLEAFNRLGGGTQHWCRDCFREYFRRRGDKHRAQSASARRSRVAAARRFIRHFLAEHPCVDCGDGDPRVLDFDHVGEKRGQISRMVWNVSLATLVAEMAECEIRCCNCHRRATASRRGPTGQARSTVSVEPP